MSAEQGELALSWRLRGSSTHLEALNLVRTAGVCVHATVAEVGSYVLATKTGAMLTLGNWCERLRVEGLRQLC